MIVASVVHISTVSTAAAATTVSGNRSIRSG
jgi:hypothetical protein